MAQRNTLVAVAIMSGLLSGCAGQVHLSSKTMCEAHGGTYSPQAKQCTYPAQVSTRAAEQICEMHGGHLDPVSDLCVIHQGWE